MTPACPVIQESESKQLQRRPQDSTQAPLIRPGLDHNTAEPSQTASLPLGTRPLHGLHVTHYQQLGAMNDSLNPIYRDLMEQGLPPQGWGRLATGLDSQIAFQEF